MLSEKKKKTKKAQKDRFSRFKKMLNFLEIVFSIRNLRLTVSNFSFYEGEKLKTSKCDFSSFAIPSNFSCNGAISNGVIWIF